MKRNQAVRACVFFIVCIIILGLADHVLVNPFVRKIDVIRAGVLYDEDGEDAWDAAIVGTSAVYNGWIGALAWKENGIRVYPVSFANCSLPFYKNLMIEARKRKKIDCFIIDLRGLRELTAPVKEQQIRSITDAMPVSRNWLDAIQRGFEVTRESNTDLSIIEDKVSYYFPLFKYHGRWSALKRLDYIAPEDEYKGAFEVAGRAFKVRPFEEPELTDECGQLNERQQKYLLELLDYAKEEKLRVLFTSFPAYNGLEEQKIYNEAARIVTEHGFDIVNFNTKEMYEILQLDFSKDLWNERHLNSRGAKKLSSWLGHYVAGYFGMEDRRGDASCKEWDDAWTAYEKQYEAGWEKAEKSAEKK